MAIANLGKKRPHATDVHVGSRIRMRRMMVGLSQEKLGARLDLTFQQVQKYEKGANRVGASRLQQIATILDVPVAYFFERLPGPPVPEGVRDIAAEFMLTPDGLRLAAAFQKITDKSMRHRIVDLVEQIVPADAVQQAAA